MFEAILQITHWYNKTAADIATALSTPATLQPMTLQKFFFAVSQSSGLPEKLGELWGIGGGRFVDRTEAALEKGDLRGVQGYLATIPGAGRTGVGNPTLNAINTVIAANTLNAGGTQVDFTAQAVTDELTAAGYSWTNGEWVRTRE